MPRKPPSTAEIVRGVLEIYQRHVDDRPLPRQCEGRAECCRFRLTGKTPMVTLGEAITAAAGWKAAGRKGIAPGPARGGGPESCGDGACPFLAGDGRCANYKHRPLGCRTHFCQPAGGPYPRQHVVDAIRALEELDEALGGDGPRPLPAAAGSAWETLQSGGRRAHGRRSRHGPGRTGR